MLFTLLFLCMISRRHLFIDDIKLRDFVNNHELRFFKHRKYLLNKLLDQNNGFIIKTCSWDYTYLLKDYEITNKIKHPNVIKHYCYFETEFDIIDYFTSENNKEEDLAVIISPYYPKVNLDNKSIRQIILILYLLFYEYHINFKTIDVNNILISDNYRQQTIKYNILGKVYEIKTHNIIIFDNFEHHFIDNNIDKLFENIFIITGEYISYHNDNPLHILEYILNTFI